MGDLVINMGLSGDEYGCCCDKLDDMAIYGVIFKHLQAQLVVLNPSYISGWTNVVASNNYDRHCSRSGDLP